MSELSFIQGENGSTGYDLDSLSNNNNELSIKKLEPSIKPSFRKPHNKKHINDPVVNIGLDMIANPKKLMKKQFIESEDSFFEESEEHDIHAHMDDYPIMPPIAPTQKLSFDESSTEEISYDNKHMKSPEEEHRRKQELLYEFVKFSHKGVRPGRRFDMKSDLDDMEWEYERLNRQVSLKKSIQFQRKFLMATVSGIEWGNKKWDPAGLAFDGWSESMMEDIHNYDEVFEELHDKYASKVSVAPELKLIMMVGGSAFWYHMTSQMCKSVMPDLQKNPEFMKSMRSAAAVAMKTMKDPIDPPSNSYEPRGEMRGPDVSVKNVLDSMLNRNPGTRGEPMASNNYDAEETYDQFFSNPPQADFSDLELSSVSDSE